MCPATRAVFQNAFVVWEAYTIQWLIQGPNGLILQKCWEFPESLSEICGNFLGASPNSHIRLAIEAVSQNSFVVWLG